MAGSIIRTHASPMKPRVTFAEQLEENFIWSSDESDFIKKDEKFSLKDNNLISSNESTDDSNSEENVNEGIDRTLNEIYELRKLLSDLKHDKLGLDIPSLSPSRTKEFHFQPNDICSPKSYSSPIIKKRNNTQDLRRNTETYDNSSSINQSPNVTPEHKIATNDEPGHVKRVLSSQSATSGSHVTSQSMKSNLDGQSVGRGDISSRSNVGKTSEDNISINKYAELSNTLINNEADSNHLTIKTNRVKSAHSNVLIVPKHDHVRSESAQSQKSTRYVHSISDDELTDSDIEKVYVVPLLSPSRSPRRKDDSNSHNLAAERVPSNDRDSWTVEVLQSDFRPKSKLKPRVSSSQDEFNRHKLELSSNSEVSQNISAELKDGEVSNLVINAVQVPNTPNEKLIDKSIRNTIINKTDEKTTAEGESVDLLVEEGHENKKFHDLSNDTSKESTKLVSTNPITNVKEIQKVNKRTARERSLSNVSKRSTNIARHRSLSDSRSKSPIVVNNSKNVHKSSQNNKIVNIRKNQVVPENISKRPVSTSRRSRADRSTSRLNIKNTSERNSSLSPERKSNGHSRGRNRSPSLGDGNTIRQSRSRSIRRRTEPNINKTRSASENAMTTKRKNIATRGSRSLSTKRKTNPRLNNNLQVRDDSNKPKRKFSFTLDLVKKVGDKYKKNDTDSIDSLRQNTLPINGRPTVASQFTGETYGRNLDSHFEENILLRDSYAQQPYRNGMSPQSNSNGFYNAPNKKNYFTGNQSFNPRVNSNYGYESMQLPKTALGAWLYKWNPFRNLFGGPRRPPINVRPKPASNYSRSFEGLVPKYPGNNLSRTNSSSKFFIQDPKNPNNVLIAEEVGYVLGDPRKIYEDSKQDEESSYDEGFSKNMIRKAMITSKFRKKTTTTTKKSPISISSKKKVAASPKKKVRSKISNTRPIIKRTKPRQRIRPVKKKIRLTLAEIAKRVQGASLNLGANAPKKSPFAIIASTIASKSGNSKTILNKSPQNKLGPSRTPKSILRGPPKKKYPTDPTAVRPVHFRPGTIPAVQEIPSYAQGSPKLLPQVKVDLPPQTITDSLRANVIKSKFSENQESKFGAVKQVNVQNPPRQFPQQESKSGVVKQITVQEPPKQLPQQAARIPPQNKFNIETVSNNAMNSKIRGGLSMGLQEIPAQESQNISPKETKDPQKSNKFGLGNILNNAKSFDNRGLFSKRVQETSVQGSSEQLLQEDAKPAPQSNRRRLGAMLSNAMPSYNRERESQGGQENPQSRLPPQLRIGSLAKNALSSQNRGKMMRRLQNGINMRQFGDKVKYILSG